MRRTWIKSGVLAAIIIAAAAGVIYWRVAGSRILIDSSTLQAPIIDLSPTVGGKLQSVFVNEGDEVPANTPVAQVGNELIKTKVSGLIVNVPNEIGAQIAPDQSVVQMIDPSQLRVVGKIDENKGLSRIALGDPVTFTVDAFGSRTYSGIVDEISPISVQSGIVFNISDSRPVQQFEVKVRFDTAAHPELKNGMSARIWVYPSR